MFAKLLVGCFLLATLLIVGGTFVFKKETRPPAQGNYLAKHYRRYLGYEDRSGRGMTNVLEVVSEDARLRRALRGPGGPVTSPPEDVPSIASVGEVVNLRSDSPKAEVNVSAPSRATVSRRRKWGGRVMGNLE